MTPRIFKLDIGKAKKEYKLRIPMVLMPEIAKAMVRGSYNYLSDFAIDALEEKVLRDMKKTKK